MRESADRPSGRRRRTTARAIGLAFLAWSLSLAQAAQAQLPTLDFRDMREIRSKPIATRPAAGTPPIVREGQSAPNASSGPGDSSLGPPIARLSLDTRGLLAAAELPVGVMSQIGAPFIEFAIADYVLHMAIVERVVDRDFEAVHYTLVDPDSTDYARLTIATDGPEVTGTIFRDREEYRVLPERENQLVHPVLLFRGEFRRADGPELETRAGRLEARHLQMAWVAERQPERFRTTAGGGLTAFKSHANGTPVLGRIDVFAAMQTDADGQIVTDSVRLTAVLQAFLDAHRHLTLSESPAQVTTGRSDLNGLYAGRANGGTIHFRQIVDGVEVDLDGELRIDRTGNVLEFHGPLMPSSIAERRQNAISEDRARSIATAALQQEMGDDRQLEVRTSELRYEPSTDRSALNLLWRIILVQAGCPQNFYVDVRALRGEIADLGVGTGVRGPGEPGPSPRDACPR